MRDCCAVVVETMTPSSGRTVRVFLRDISKNQGLGCFLGHANGLAGLRAVAVDCDCLQATAPCLDVRIGNVVDGCAACRFTVFEIAPDKNGWAAAIMSTCPSQRIERTPLVGTNAPSNTATSASRRQEPFDRAYCFNVRNDSRDLSFVVAEACESAGTTSLTRSCTLHRRASYR